MARARSVRISKALALGGSSDVDILNFALTLEYLETAFYQVKGASVGLSGEAKTLAKSLGEEDAEHVAALTKAISGAGAKPVAQAEVRLPGH